MKNIPTAHNDVYFTSDTHLGHRNIVRGVSDWKDPKRVRDFDTLDEHDTFIINSINARVKKHDYLIHHGDFILGGKVKIELFLNKINCDNIIWIMGNHDGINTNYIHPKLKGVYEYQCFLIGPSKFVTMHYPIDSFFNKKRGYIHTHGHIHSKVPITGYNRIDVGVEANNFKPLLLAEVLELANQSTIISWEPSLTKILQKRIYSLISNLPMKISSLFRKNGSKK